MKCLVTGTTLVTVGFGYVYEKPWHSTQFSSCSKVSRTPSPTTWNATACYFFSKALLRNASLIRQILDLFLRYHANGMKTGNKNCNSRKLEHFQCFMNQRRQCVCGKETCLLMRWFKLFGLWGFHSGFQSGSHLQNKAWTTEGTLNVSEPHWRIQVLKI